MERNNTAHYKRDVWCQICGKTLYGPIPEYGDYCERCIAILDTYEEYLDGHPEH